MEDLRRHNLVFFQGEKNPNEVWATARMDGADMNDVIKDCRERYDLHEVYRKRGLTKKEATVASRVLQELLTMMDYKWIKARKSLD